MTSKGAIDGTMAGTGLTMPVWIQALEGWLQLAVVVLSLALLIYTIRVRRMELKAHEAKIAALGGDGDAG